MKRISVFLAALACVLTLGSCKRSLNYIIGHEPSISGIVKEVYDGSILIENETGEYCVSTEAECADSMTYFSEGDNVSVYYDGYVSESYPMQINTVYAITLLNPADRSENDVS